MVDDSVVDFLEDAGFTHFFRLDSQKDDERLDGDSLDEDREENHDDDRQDEETAEGKRLHDGYDQRKPDGTAQAGMII